MPDTGVATLEAQPDEEYAFAPTMETVAEWRLLSAGALGDRAESSAREGRNEGGSWRWR